MNDLYLHVNDLELKIHSFVFLSLVLVSIKRKRICEEVDHRTLPRSTRAKYSHEHAYARIQQDYPGEEPTLLDDFKSMFRISRWGYEFIFNQLTLSCGLYRTKGRATIEAKIIIAMKHISYGVTPRALWDSFKNKFIAPP